mgnify:FL=1|jgi:hypothetical protein
MGIISLTTEQWLLSAAAVATVAFLGVALIQPSVFDPKPDWDVSDGCIGGLKHEDAGIAVHHHPDIWITVDGEFLQIPANTGIDQAGCREGMRWIHVHDVPNWEQSGPDYTRLHIETPRQMNPPIGAFFEVWEREGGPALTEDMKFDINRNGVSDWEEYDITLVVNGEANDRFEEYVMIDRDKIELSFDSK